MRGLPSRVLFVTLLVELYRLLIVYPREHRVAVDFVMEIAPVSALREVVLRGVTELTWERLLAISAFVLTLGCCCASRPCACRSGSLRGSGW